MSDLSSTDVTTVAQRPHILRRLKTTVCRRAFGFARREDGAMTMFSLYIFLMIVFICGMAVDLMRFETQRAALQSTLDAATLAGANLNSTADAEELVKDFLEKRGYDPALATIDLDETFSGGDPNTNDPGTLVARTLTADYRLEVDTIFMSMMDILTPQDGLFETLGTTAAGGAAEGLTTVEISLVVDISGSMAGDRNTALKTAAKNFVDQMIDPTREDLPVTMSIVPFNHAVVVPESILSRVNADGSVPIPEELRAPYDGALEAYPRTASGSKCVRFYDDEMVTTDLQVNTDPPVADPNYLALRAITQTQPLDRMAYYDPNGKSAGPGGNWDRPDDTFNRRCDPTRPAILPFETNVAALKTHIDSLDAAGWTANDVGLKWGVALLDPAFRGVVQSMIAADELPDALENRPYDYDPANFMKVVVLMTDGANTNQYDLEDQVKAGPSRVWYSEQAAREVDPDAVDPNNPTAEEDWSDILVVDTNEDGSRDRDKEWYDGYFVEMPDNDPSERWMRVHWIGNLNDGVLYSETEIADQLDDMRQLDWTELYDQFSERGVARLFRDNQVGDQATFEDLNDTELTVENGASADYRMSGTDDDMEHGLCDAAKVDNDIIIFTIAFQAGSHAESVMRDCATGTSGYFFDADDDEELFQAFETIATTITKLRLTQ